jgi:hypothetical protein
MALIVQERVPNTVAKVCYIIKPQYKSAQCNQALGHAWFKQWPL